MAHLDGHDLQHLSVEHVLLWSAQAGEYSMAHLDGHDLQQK